MGENGRRGPVMKSHVGRFQISIWKKKEIVPARHSSILEREFEFLHACVQYGRFNRETRTWENQTIWCNSEELRDLANVLDELNENREAPLSAVTNHRSQLGAL